MKRNQEAMDRQKANIRNKLGPKKYDELYQFLMYHRSQGASDDDMLYEELKERVNYNKYLMTLVFQLDGIVNRELISQPDFLQQQHQR